MTTLSLGQAARLTGRGKTILARAISSRFFAGSTEDGGSNSSESARVYPFPAPVEMVAELRTAAPMFTTTAVILTIGIARWIEGRAQDVNLVAFSGAILIILGVIADRIT